MSGAPLPTSEHGPLLASRPSGSKQRPFVVGSLTPGADLNAAIYVHTDQDTMQRKAGELVTRWGYALQVDEDVIYPDELDAWRQCGDDLADGVVAALDIKPGVDSLHRIREHLSTDSPDPRVTAFWDAVNRLPPDSISALPKGRKPTPADFMPDEAIERSDRQPEPTLAEGQAFYARYAVQISSALVHFSLAAGLTSPKLMPTLRETNYLTSGSLDVTFRRLLETAQMVIDAMSDMSIGGRGWESTIRVRLLHAQVRARIKAGKGRLNELDIERDGVPINKEDMFATLGGFSVACLWSMRRLNYYVTEREQLAYLAAWRHIGYYIGVEPALLERYFTRGLSCAEKSFASLAFHIFGDVPPANFYETTTYRILLATSDRPPVRTSVNHHIELTRIIVGPGLAERLALPPVGLSVRARVWAEIYAARFVNWFGRSYRKGWEVERTKLYREIIEAVVAWQLGERRTRFVAKTENDYGKPLDEAGDGEPSRVTLGAEAGRAVTRRFQRLIREMLLVCVGSFALAATGMCIVIR